MALCTHLSDFFNKYYNGASMKLTVVGRESLNTLEKWARKFFANVKLESIPKLDQPKFENPWRPQILYKLQPVEHTDTLEISWWVPPKSDVSHLQQPELYLSILLANECQGSLFSFFKDRGWATSLIVDVGGDQFDSTSFGRSFNITIALTNSGLRKKYEVVSFIYQYIQLLRVSSLPKWVFDQHIQVRTNDFRSLECDGLATTPRDFAIYLVENMLSYPVTHAIVAGYSHEWNPDAIKGLMAHLHPKNMRMILLSKSLSIKATDADAKVEPWYSSLYLEETIPMEFQKKWRKTNTEQFQVNECFHFPSKNPYIPDYVRRELGDLPFSQLLDTPSMRIYFRGGEGGNVYANFLFHLNLKIGDAKEHLKAEILIDLLKDNLHEVLHKGEDARYDTSISLLDNRVELKVFGYRGKLLEYIADLLKGFTDFLPSEVRFEIVKKSMIGKRRNSHLGIAQQSKEVMVQLLMSSLSNEKTLVELESISFVDLTSIALLSEIYIEGLFYGDIDQDEALAIVKVLQDFQMQAHPKELRDPKELRGRRRIVQVPLGRRLKIDIDAENNNEPNSLAKLYFQIGRGHEQAEEVADWAKLSEGLGYDIECCPHLVDGVNVDGFYIQVLSSNHTPYYLAKRVWDFIKCFGEKLERMTPTTFGNFKETLASTIPDGLGEDVSGTKLWGEIVMQRYRFEDFYNGVRCAVSGMEREHLFEWYKRIFRSARSSRMVYIGIWSCRLRKNLRFRRMVKSSSFYMAMASVMKKKKKRSQKK